MNKIIFLTMFLFAIPLQSKSSLLQFPKLFQGTWDATEASCTKLYSDARLLVDSNSVGYWESYGQISKVDKANKKEFVAQFEMTGEGEEWVTTIHYRLSDSSNKLTEIFDDGSSFVRVRCQHDV